MFRDVFPTISFRHSKHLLNPIYCLLAVSAYPKYLVLSAYIAKSTRSLSLTVLEAAIMSTIPGKFAFPSTSSDQPANAL